MTTAFPTADNVIWDTKKVVNINRERRMRWVNLKIFKSPVISEVAYTSECASSAAISRQQRSHFFLNAFNLKAILLTYLLNSHSLHYHSYFAKSILLKEKKKASNTFLCEADLKVTKDCGLFDLQLEPSACPCNLLCPVRMIERRNIKRLKIM